ncbi:MAG: dephospho-CoA kinase, partial [Ruminococcaceae bacterium]|nr:dephospho-CoA kinase [Oscillospiraceae bacterium]
MKRIALTGPSGAGKGYVASLLRKRGFAVLDADAVVHKLYAGGTLPREIAGLFGDRVLTREG